VPHDLRDLPAGAERGLPVTIDFEDRRIPAFAGEPVAVALYAAGVRTLARSSKYHRPRGFFCLDGHCASCLLRIDGRPNQRACLTPARAGLACARQNAFPSADLDLLAAADWMFPEGMDHHTLMTGSHAGNALFLKIVREMGGSGTLPDPGGTELHPARAPDGEAPGDDPRRPERRPPEERLDVCVVGGGPAGLCAARAVAEAVPGVRIALFDEQAAPGGSLLAEPGGTARAQRLAGEARAAGVKLVSGAAAIAYYPEDIGPDGRPGILAVTVGDRLVRVSARRTLYATGAYDQNLPCADNDRPGVMAARACGRLAFQWGVRPVPGKRRVIILDGAPTGVALERSLGAAGVETLRVDLGCETVLGVRGAQRARGVEIVSAGGRRKIEGDVVAVATLPAPASELPRQQGAAVVFDPARGGFAAIVDENQATTAPGVFACGDVTGYAGTAAAEAAGTRAGRALAATLALAAAALFSLLPTGCATAPPAPVVAPPAPSVFASAQIVEPPPFAGAPTTPEQAADARTALRRSILDAAWRTVRDKHFDKTLGGIDWNAVRAKYEPLAIAAPSEAAFYRVLNQMIGELGQSHMMITGPGAEDEEAADEMPQPGETPAETRAPAPSPAPTSGQAPAPVSDAIGEPGLTVRVIEGRPTISRVRPGSAADKAGLLPGFVITQIGGRPLTAPINSSRPLRPVEERFAVRRAAAWRLAGEVGSRVTVAYLDEHDRPGKAVLVRDPPSGHALQIGYLPVLYPEVRAYEVGDVGVIAFNIFILDPVLEGIKRAVARFQAHHVRAMVLDLRGNPGGQGAMAIPVASLFVSAPVTLGTLKFRDLAQTFTAKPELGAIPFTGSLAILTDEGTASAAEMLTAGLQEAGRAVVVGDTTLGAVLPSLVQALPGGAVMQYVVADFKTPKGVVLEGRGVQPDKRVVETRAALRTGRDPVLDAALVAIRASRHP
jgi:sarcosine oxidase subunit alpha